MIPREFEAAAAEGAAPSFAARAATVGKRSLETVYYVFILLIPVETISTIKKEDGSTVAYARLVGILLFALALVNWRVCFRKFPPSFWMFAWYLGTLSLSQLWIPRFLDARFVDERMTLLQMLALFLISANLFSDAGFRVRLLRFYGWWVGLVALLMLFGAFGGAAIQIEGRDTILGQDPNIAAVFFASAAICIAGDGRNYASRAFLGRIIIALTAISALILAILQTGSRGGLLVFATGFAGLAICGTKATFGKRAGIAFSVFAVLGVAIAWQFALNTTTAVRLTEAYENGDTAGRTVIYQKAWAMVRERPLFGYGGANNTFQLGVELGYAAGGKSYYPYYRDTHNLLLAVLTEVGIVGAIPFAGAILFALWKAGRYGFRTGDALPFALVCSQITANTSLTGYHQKLFWIILAAAAACGLPDDSHSIGEQEEIV